MATQEEIAEAISEAAIGPKSVTVGAQTTVARDIGDILKARDAVASDEAGTKAHFGLRFSQFIPHGGGG